MVQGLNGEGDEIKLKVEKFYCLDIGNEKKSKCEFQFWKIIGVLQGDKEGMI